MLEKVSPLYAFWTLILQCCDKSLTLKVSSPVQTIMGWNASFNMQLDPYPDRNSIIIVRKDGMLIMQVRGTQSKDVIERFEFTGNTIENQISFVLRNVTLGDAGTYTAIEGGFLPGVEQTLIVKAQDRLYMVASITGGGSTLGRTTNPLEATVKLSQVPMLADPEIQTHANRGETAVIRKDVIEDLLDDGSEEGEEEERALLQVYALK